ncbi:MAG: lipoprotein insertase outer membrane protein LolB [Pseudomonadota bacterium]
MMWTFPLFVRTSFSFTMLWGIDKSIPDNLCIKWEDFLLLAAGLSIYRRYVKHGKLLICIFPLIAGCVTVTSQPAVVKTVTTEPVTGTRAMKAADFNLLGRISVSNGNERSSGSLRWQHTKENDEILLFTSLGQAVAEITQDHSGARLITAKLEAFYAADVESLTAEILGWRLPLNGLQYWVQGLHSPVTVSEKDLDSENRVLAIRQDGWQIRYSGNSSSVQTENNVQRSKVLKLNYKDLKIKLVVDSWEIE